MQGLTYQEMRTIRDAERFIRDICGVGTDPSDHDCYTDKKQRVIRFSKRAQGICRLLSKIGQRTQIMGPGGDSNLRAI